MFNASTSNIPCEIEELVVWMYAVSSWCIYGNVIGLFMFKC